MGNRQLGSVDTGLSSARLDAYSGLRASMSPTTSLPPPPNLSAHAQSGSKTTLTFRRPVAASDAWDVAVPRGVIYVLWAYGSSLGSSIARRGSGAAAPGLPVLPRASSISFAQHSTYGSATVNMFSGSVSGQSVGSDGDVNPAMVLVGIVVALLGAVGLVRLVQWMSKPSDDELASRPQRVPIPAASGSQPSVALAPSTSNRLDAPSRPPPRLQSPAGSARLAIASSSAALEAGFDRSDSNRQLIPADNARPHAIAQVPKQGQRPSAKGMAHSITTFFRRRLPRTDKSVGFFMIALLYLVANVAAYILGHAADPARKMGKRPTPM